jgi:ABC-type branched-subunit amino acid transport system permease subunit
MSGAAPRIKPPSFPQRLGYGTLVTALVGLAFLFVVPRMFSLFMVLQITIFVVMSILALSLALVWGLGGILCFGQAAFFGLGGYSYAVAVENMDGSSWPILIAIVVPAVFAAAVGSFMFFGRLSELYVGVVTLCTSLILFNFVNSTSGPQYAIGQAALNGFNGMSSVPTINWPGDPNDTLDPQGMFYLCAGSLIIIYLLCKWIEAMSFGRVARGVKENEERAELMGYNAAAVKLAMFTIGAAMAGYAGALFVNWNAFISPGVFSLATTAQTIIWIIVGGAGTFVGPVIGAFGLQYLSTKLGTSGVIDVNLVLGLILMLFVVFVPQGLVPTIRRGALALIARRKSRSQGQRTEHRPRVAADVEAKDSP